MQTITLTRKDLYEEVWTNPLTAFCQTYDVPEDGVESICRRLNVPMPGIGHWRKIKAGKRSDWIPLPPLSHGTESVVLYKRDDARQRDEHVVRLNSLLAEGGGSARELSLDEKVFDKLVLSTKEGMFKHWETQYKYSEKNKLLAIHVSPEVFCRALQIADLVIKLLRFRGHDIVVNQSSTFAVVDGERISISIRERNRRVEYRNEYDNITRDNHPTGSLF